MGLNRNTFQKSQFYDSLLVKEECYQIYFFEELAEILYLLVCQHLIYYYGCSQVYCSNSFDILAANLNLRRLLFRKLIHRHGLFEICLVGCIWQEIDLNIIKIH